MSDALPARVAAGLRRRGGTLAVAESLTGGGLCARLVTVPGVSAVLRGGVVAYATELKVALLGVDERLLAAHGPVHPEVARQMALGVARRLGADHGVATTGVAGPGAADGRPAGTVHVATCGPGGVRTRSWLLAGPRHVVRRAAEETALALLAEVVAEGASRR
ncbi:CinA family protein [Georgenia sp. 10Sc9-8]|uniref:CinA family protein n=1 Tax=Georgenia halotolerans TaxID=3028317 RepID=A0ABT5U0Q6_9MICO|nr:CinA family protein [Georgenia halotolerans]